MAYTVERAAHRVIIRGDGIPIDDLNALCAVWLEAGIDTFVPSVAAAEKALFAITRRDDVDAWRSAIAARAERDAWGDAETAWINGVDTGTSSKTIFSVLAKHPGREFVLRGWGGSVPHDPADFGRCHRLLALFPEWRARLPEVAAKYPAWTKLVEHWDELTALFLEESPLGRCPKLYRRMQELH